MIPAYSYQSVSPPPDEKTALFDRELKLFAHRLPDPHSTSEVERRGWGFPDYLRPPVDCYEVVAANFKREIASTKLTEPLKPEHRFALLSTMLAYFAWLRTKKGTDWLLHLYGIAIVPHHPGYAYFYETERLIEPDFALRIYDIDRTARTLKPPIDYYDRKLIDELKTLLEERRGPSPRPMPHVTDGMWEWIGSYIRNWLTETKADTSWPTTKPDRLSGYLWAKGLLRPGSQTEFAWNVIGQAELYNDNGRVYRIQKPAYVERFENGVLKKVAPEHCGVLWTDRKKMRTVPLDELDQRLGVPAATTQAKHRCRGCGHVRCCSSGGPADRLCMNCRGTQLETGERASLDWCRYRECKNCPEHLRNVEDLINLVSRLNSSSDRVHRT